jgi:hypothetical protein
MIKFINSTRQLNIGTHDTKKLHINSDKAKKEKSKKQLEANEGREFSQIQWREVIGIGKTKGIYNKRHRKIDAKVKLEKRKRKLTSINPSS